MDREVMAFDVVIVGAGPAGLSAAVQLMQKSKARGQEISVCVLEKGADVGAHIVSGAVFDPMALNELLPDWQHIGFPVTTPVTQDDFYWLKNIGNALKIPHSLLPGDIHNDGNYIISLGAFCKALAQHAERLGVEIFPGFSAAEPVIENDKVIGVLTGDMGLDRTGAPTDNYMPGIILKARQTLFCEGARGHIGKSLITRFELDKGKEAPHFGLGFKEIWKIPATQHQPGRVQHAIGWPLSGNAHGGSFCYHYGDRLVAVGLIVDLDYTNPHLSPYHEFQRFKHHPLIARQLAGGERLSYGARAINKSGFNSLPKMTFPGGMLLGCDAGTLNVAKIKGTHTAMKSGMLAADAILAGFAGDQQDEESVIAATFETMFRESWLYREMKRSQNLGPAVRKWGPFWGGGFYKIESLLFNNRSPFTLSVNTSDAASLVSLPKAAPITYPAFDNVLSFDRLSSVYLTNIAHREDQPNHLLLNDSSIPVNSNLPLFDEPAQRYCPAGVYEIVHEDGKDRLQINSQNCIHCKTCDIKDPAENITWTAPEGGSGPNYLDM